MMERFNDVSNWVFITVGTCENPQRRIKLFRKFLEIADACRRLGNFNGMMEILSGLDRGPIFRMKKTVNVRPT